MSEFIKVAVNKSFLTKGYKRGIDFHTLELAKAINKKKDEYKVAIDIVQFENKNLEEYSVLHYSRFNPYFISLPVGKLLKRYLGIRTKQKIVLTIHDLIYLHFPENYPPGLKGRVKLALQKLLIKNVDRILTISNSSKKDIVKYLNVEPGKIDAVPLAPRDIFFGKPDKNDLREVKRKYKLPNTFVLYVGDVNYNKNLPALIKACRNIKTKLVIVGKQAASIEDLYISLMDIKGPKDWYRFLFNKIHPEHQHLTKVRRLLKKDGVIRTGFVSDEELVCIYKLADVYCQASLSEGFGLPVVEAMAAGTPVCCSNINVHREIAGSAALYFNPRNTDDIADKIKTILGSTGLKRKLINKGLKNVKKLNWEKTAAETAKFYQKA